MPNPEKAAKKRHPDGAATRLLTALVWSEEICTSRMDNTDRMVGGELHKGGVDARDWVSASLCCNGLEQAMKSVIALQEDAKVPNTHDLVRLYRCLPAEVKEKVESYYRAYYSFHRYNRPCTETAEKFIEMVGAHYTKWRYSLREEFPDLPPPHPRFMIEIWRALLMASGKGLRDHITTSRIAERISIYLGSNVFADADAEWQHTCNEEGIEDFDIRMSVLNWVESQRWVDGEDRRRVNELIAGIHVFRHLADKKVMPHGSEQQKWMRQVFDSAHKAIDDCRNKLIASHSLTVAGFISWPNFTTERHHEFLAFCSLCEEELEWNHKKGVFEIQGK